MKNPVKDGAVLIVPACEKGRGGGHLSRSVYLLKALRKRGRDAFLWIPSNLVDEIPDRFSFLFAEAGFPGKFIISDRNELPGQDWAFFILDRFKTPQDEFSFWSGFPAQVPLIGIDEGGPCRGSFDFLIDLLPSLSEHEPNLSAPGLLPLPKNRRSKSNPADGKTLLTRVLISFGAEDSAGLGISAARSLSSVAVKRGPFSPTPEITLITGSLNNGNAGAGQTDMPGVKIIEKVPELMEHFAEYDLLITHFGLGAFEAVYAGIPVLLISPTPYHEKLANNSGFYTIRHGGFSWDQIFDSEFHKDLCLRRDKIACRYGLEEDQKEDLGLFISSLAPDASRDCPVCGYAIAAGTETGLRAIGRFPGETYRRCPRCGNIKLSRLNPPSIEYEKDYFFGSYKKQYGKTYLEDFPNLKEMGRRRLEYINLFLKHPEEHNAGKPCLLDIGCAYGPFLAAAAEGGFTPCGVEPARDAVRYVSEELGFKAWHGFFPDALESGEAGSFDALTLWYVIEHFREPGNILREIYRLLRPDGVLAFSTPSFSGISGRKNLRAFLKNSPPDHFTVWSPRTCKSVLADCGFRLRKIVVSGHHPERFPFLGRFARPEKKGPLYKLLLFVSRVFRLGDTFEAYAVKN